MDNKNQKEARKGIKDGIKDIKKEQQRKNPIKQLNHFTETERFLILKHSDTYKIEIYRLNLRKGSHSSSSSDDTLYLGFPRAQFR